MLIVEAARRSPVGLALIGVLIVLAAAGAFILWGTGTRPPPPELSRDIPGQVRLPARPEDIEAHGTQARSVLAPDNARQRNAAVAFAPGPISPSRPFVFKGSEDDRARALRCLATAVLYEAGDDTEGEAAVAQVVLNRVRHPAFPATICGVVYQGASRTTGCQFTFTCDGSLRRVMSDAARGRAREVASRALAGKIDPAVGLATHYHTDWVYPYWSPELDKIARVGTHLFFGWRGSWGGPNAFKRQYQGGEPSPPGMAIAGSPTSEVAVFDESNRPKILGLPLPPAKLPAEMGNVPLYGNRLRLARSDGRAFGLLALPGAPAEKLVNASLALCGNPGFCQVTAWSNEDDIPGEYPIPAGARGTMVFEYVRDGETGKSTLRFDCALFPNKDTKLCI